MAAENEELSAFELLEDEVRRLHVGNRSESTALLAWFLETVWRMDPEDVSDSITDGGGDKGIDALTVDDDLREITVFQSKRRKSEANTQGDGDLKTFIGVAHYFEDEVGLDALLASSPNAEVRNLIERLDVKSKLAVGNYVVRLVFITNAPLDASGVDYAATRQGRSRTLDVWDRDRMASVARRTRGLAIQGEEVTLPTASPLILESLDPGTRLAVALIAATELVKLPGIENLMIFDLNVRLALGRTRINRELASTIRDSNEHALFPAYHNGLTLLTEKIVEDGGEIHLTGVSVVNGCQSLVALYENRSSLTPELRVLVKIVELGASLDLVDQITYRTNNQNPVNTRDLRSTDPIQRDLQDQVRSTYGDELTYVIRSGEAVSTEAVLDNSSAAQLIMAVYLKEPWNAVRRVRLFDQDYHRVFGREIDGHKLFLLYHLNQLVLSKRSELRGDLEASFASVRYTFLYLLTSLIRFFPLGEELLNSPERWLPEEMEGVMRPIEDLADDVVANLNFYIETKLDEAAAVGTLFDPKTVFKSKAGVQAIEQDVLQQARRNSRRDTSYGFDVPPRA